MVCTKWYHSKGCKKQSNGLYDTVSKNFFEYWGSIFAVSANFSIFIILNVHRVAVGVAVWLQGLHDF